MKAKTIEEQIKEVNAINFEKERRQYAQEGIATAIEGGKLVTIGNGECDYSNFKEFCTFQIMYMGFEEFADATEWEESDLADFLANVDSSDTVWKDIVMDYFNGMEAEEA